MNPLKLLHTHCGWSLMLINREITGFSYLDTLHKAILSDNCIEKHRKKAFTAVMIEWGVYYKNRDPRHKDLWKCYFPDTPPHIYHLLHYVHSQVLSGDPTAIFHGKKRVKKGYSDRVIGKILRQPKLWLHQNDRIRRFAIEYIDAIGSKSRKEGPDPAYMGLYYALNDHKRLYKRGEIVVD